MRAISLKRAEARGVLFSPANYFKARCYPAFSARMPFRSTREARERFLHLARRTEESAPLFLRVHENAGANPAGALTWTQQLEKCICAAFSYRLMPRGMDAGWSLQRPVENSIVLRRSS